MKPTVSTIPIILASLALGGAAAFGSSNPDATIGGLSATGIMGFGLTGSAGIGGWILSQLFAIRRDVADLKTEIAVLRAVVNERTDEGHKFSDSKP